MRSRAAFSGVSRSEYLLVSIDFVLSFFIRDAVTPCIALTLSAVSMRRKYLVAWLTIPIGYTGANGTPSSAIFRGCRRGAERDTRGGAASRVAAAVKPANP